MLLHHFGRPESLSSQKLNKIKRISETLVLWFSVAAAGYLSEMRTAEGMAQTVKLKATSFYLRAQRAVISRGFASSEVVM